MSKLIALVATAVMVEGVRTTIQPGQELPDLHEHDARELTASGGPAAVACDFAATHQKLQQSMRQGYPFIHCA